MRNDRFYEHSYDLAFQRDIWGGALRRTTTLFPIARRDPVFFPLFSAILGAGGFGLTGTALSVAAGVSTAIAVTCTTIGFMELSL